MFESLESRQFCSVSTLTTATTTETSGQLPAVQSSLLLSRLATPTLPQQPPPPSVIISIIGVLVG